jgi:hypothetical protein
MLKLKKLFRNQFLKKNISILVFFLLFSFLFGNIFGLNAEILLLKSPNWLFFIIPLFIEIINFFSFVSKKNPFFWNKNKIKNSQNFTLIFISIRRGFFLGVFIEAFKVGS